jgi:hypothetical protein
MAKNTTQKNKEINDLEVATIKQQKLESSFISNCSSASCKTKIKVRV